jgi:hypothetical protein
MKIARRPLAFGALIVSVSAAQAASLPVCPIQSGQTVSYDIVRGGNVIGRQTVQYTVDGRDLTVEISVAASLHALGIRVYNYEHHGTEHWHDGQMVSLVSRTNDDGTPRQVNATRDPATGWHGTHGLAPGMAPLLATSLWNSETVVQTRLLDRETGEVVAVRGTPVGDEVLKLGTRQVTAHRFDLAGVVSGNVWYDAGGCWVQALFHTRVDGSQIEVRAR